MNYKERWFAEFERQLSDSDDSDAAYERAAETAREVVQDSLADQADWLRKQAKENP